ncbi:hypothetical protein [Pseudomonas sp. SLFW]|uniref:hypothetical protein n=1 Tax=Pseudomonas sp. SLFW TaxID=2683259 RepID=UPI0014134DFB|nr:hypothetical protein [Pseudomonas sp. SLFW]NBB12825.1 hypothetical protein [Pseudomonas sp. SLFW]
MNMLKSAVKVCRSASRSLLAHSRALSRLTPAITFDKTLEILARVLCVQSSGVMVCGSASASVAHFPSPDFASPKNTL